MDSEDGRTCTEAAHRLVQEEDRRQIHQAAAIKPQRKDKDKEGRGKRRHGRRRVAVQTNAKGDKGGCGIKPQRKCLPPR
jgi:hypothetical protein